MVRTETIEQFLATQSAYIPVFGLVVSLVLAALLSYILSKLYIKYGVSLSNRQKFANNFVLLATTTTLIITVVKSSLALSLGLVGALSIVRFRAAIKEPEELSFLFLNIAIGLGLGANQWKITLVSFVIISILIWARHFQHKKEENQNLCLTVSSNPSENVTLKNIISILKKHCSSVHLKRFDQANNIFEASLLVDFDSFRNLEEAKEELSKLSESIKITYLDNKGIM